MKKNILIILSFMPVLVIGQSNFSNLNSEDTNLNTNIGFQNQQILSNRANTDRKIETTLINDVKKDKTMIDFELEKSHSLSYDTKNSHKIKLLDDEKSKKILFELAPFKNIYWQPKILINSKTFFKNLEIVEPINKS